MAGIRVWNLTRRKKNPCFCQNLSFLRISSISYSHETVDNCDFFFFLKKLQEICYFLVHIICASHLKLFLIGLPPLFALFKKWQKI